MTPLHAHLDQAFDRLHDFAAVHSQLTTDDLAPILRLQEAAGVTEAERDRMRERIAEHASDEHAGAIALGILVGLFAAQFAADAGT